MFNIRKALTPAEIRQQEAERERRLQEQGRDSEGMTEADREWHRRRAWARTPAGKRELRRREARGNLWRCEHERLRRAEAAEIKTATEAIQAQYRKLHVELADRQERGADPPGWSEWVAREREQEEAKRQKDQG